MSNQTEPCPECNGEGVVSGDTIVSGTTSWGAESDMLTAYEAECDECEGTGRVEVDP